jgi:large subunit ribosomal protein L10
MVDKAKKHEVVDQMKEIFSGASSVVVANYDALSISDSDELRIKAKESGANVKVTKNTLAKIASKESKHSCVVDFFSGQTIISYSEDPVAAAKVMVDFAKKNEALRIAGGSFEGSVLDEAQVKQLANTPSLDESRAKLVGLLVAPAQKIAQVVNAPAGNLARVFSAYSSKG